MKARTRFPNVLHLLIVPIVSLFATFALTSGEAKASAFGPSDDLAGNPPLHLDCTLCHGDYPANSGNGDIEVLNLPLTFVPGNTYDLLVRIFDPGQARWGFEVAVLDPADHQAGELVVVDAANTQLSDQPGTSTDFLKQTYDGTRWGTLDGPVIWPFRWIAPQAPSVTFYIAGCASDGTEDPGQDYVYVWQVAINQATTAAQEGSWGRLKGLFR